jgi:hypothetical protein
MTNYIVITEDKNNLNELKESLREKAIVPINEDFAFGNKLMESEDFRLIYVPIETLVYIPTIIKDTCPSYRDDLHVFMVNINLPYLKFANAVYIADRSYELTLHAFIQSLTYDVVVFSSGEEQSEITGITSTTLDDILSILQRLRIVFGGNVIVSVYSCQGIKPISEILFRRSDLNIDGKVTPSFILR